MKPLALITLVLISCLSCNHSTSNKATETSNFQLVDLPYSTNCINCCESKYDSSLNIAGFNLIGQLPINSELIVLLGTIQADNILPTLVYLDNQRKVVQIDNFMTSWCGPDYGYYGFMSFQIDTNLVIQEKEIQYHFTMDSLTGEILDTIDIDTIINEFKIEPEKIKRRATTNAKFTRGNS